MIIVNKPSSTPFVATLPPAILAASPLGYWKLDESSGSTAVDSSGNGRDGSIAAGTTLAAEAGPDGVSYMRFNFGSEGNGNVTLTDINDYSLSTNAGLFVFAIVKPIATTSGRWIVTKGGTTNQYEWAMLGQSSARLQTTVWGQGGNGLQVEETSGVMSTSWQAVGVKYNGTTFNARHSHYLNSSTALSSTQGTTSNSTAYGDGSRQVVIGHRHDLPSNTGFRGAIAHVAIFSSLSDSDRDDIFAAADADGWF